MCFLGTNRYFCISPKNESLSIRFRAHETYSYYYPAISLSHYLIRREDIEFRHLSTADGLTHFSVISLYQDERDFIWCGTRNGVSLYNGREFKEYRYHKGDTTSLFCNTITAITGDRAGHV